MRYDFFWSVNCNWQNTHQNLMFVPVKIHRDPISETLSLSPHQDLDVIRTLDTELRNQRMQSWRRTYHVQSLLEIWRRSYSTFNRRFFRLWYLSGSHFLKIASNNSSSQKHIARPIQFSHGILSTNVSGKDDDIVEHKDFSQYLQSTLCQLVRHIFRMLDDPRWCIVWGLIRLRTREMLGPDSLHVIRLFLVKIVPCYFLNEEKILRQGIFWISKLQRTK